MRKAPEQHLGGSISHLVSFLSKGKYQIYPRKSLIRCFTFFSQALHLEWKIVSWPEASQRQSLPLSTDDQYVRVPQLQNAQHSSTLMASFWGESNAPWEGSSPLYMSHYVLRWVNPHVPQGTGIDTNNKQNILWAGERPAISGEHWQVNKRTGSALSWRAATWSTPILSFGKKRMIWNKQKMGSWSSASCPKAAVYAGSITQSS